MSDRVRNILNKRTQTQYKKILRVLTFIVTNHRLSFHDFERDKHNILHEERNRKIVEVFFIEKFNNSINLQKDTENLNPIYDKIII